MTSARAALLSGLISAAVSAAAVVVFYESRSTDPVQASYPGPAGAAPTPPSGRREQALAALNQDLRRQRRSLAQQVDDLGARLRAIEAARDAGADPVHAENRVLRSEVERLRRRLSVEKQERRSLEGEPIPFPPDLPDRYRQESLMRAFQEAFRRAGVAGEVQSIDCNEFPCIVYGAFAAKGRADTEKQFRALQDQLRETYPGDRDRLTTSLWTRSEKGVPARNTFGMAVYPLDPQREESADFRRRLRHRQSQYVDATMKP